jgi:hypothetical protein
MSSWDDIEGSVHGPEPGLDETATSLGNQLPSPDSGYVGCPAILNHNHQPIRTAIEIGGSGDLRLTAPAEEVELNPVRDGESLWKRIAILVGKRGCQLLVAKFLSGRFR